MAQPIIDFHCHIYPDKIAQRAVAAIQEYYSVTMQCRGVSEDLLACGREIGTCRYIVHSTATRPDQVMSINDFIAGECAAHPEFIGFGTLHPGFADLGEETRRMLGLGLCGLKLHPDFQHFCIDDDDMMPVYAAAEGKLSVLIHLGDQNSSASDPVRLLRVLDRYPGLTIIGAHFGGYSVWDHAAEALKGTDVYVDSSSSLPFISPDHALRLIEAFGTDRVLFGTDYPMWRPAPELERFEKLGLNAAERDAILYKNAEALLGITL